MSIPKLGCHLLERELAADSLVLCGGVRSDARPPSRAVDVLVSSTIC